MFTRVRAKRGMHMRIMAIDYGDARTGLAVSDATGTIAGEAWTLTERDRRRVVETVAREAAARGVSVLVLGYPKNMDGTLGPRAETSEALAGLLRARGDWRVVLWDERRTTVDAHRILSEAGKYGKKRKRTVDAVAAALILEGYLASVNR